MPALNNDHSGKNVAKVTGRPVGKAPTNSKAVKQALPDNTPSPMALGDSLFSMRKFQAETDLPIVYSDNYNIQFVGLELTHQFDTKKYRRLAKELDDNFRDTQYSRIAFLSEPQTEEDKGAVKARRLRYLTPNRFVSRLELMYHHTSDYVDMIHNDKSTIARITETWLLNLVPLSTIQSRLLEPIKWQTAGSIFGAHLAMQHGWAFNLGGGFHQSSAEMGDTFCLFSDVCLIMKYVWRKHPLQKFMIIDLDAHQGTGVERDLLKLEAKKRKMVYMVDMFNSTVSPPDPIADKSVDVRVDLGRFTSDETYLAKLQESLNTAFSQFKPNLVIYIAGQDVLKEDQLGLLNVTDGGMIKRDEMVFSYATERHRCPILMLLGGGYLNRGTKVLANSVRNLFNKDLIWGGHKSGSRSLSRPRMKGPIDATKTSERSTTSTASSSGRSGAAANGVLDPKKLKRMRKRV